MKYQIAGVEYFASSENRVLDLTLEIYETEDFYVRNALDKMLGKTLTLRAYKKSGGDINYSEKRKITKLSYGCKFSWSVNNDILKWTVGVILSDKLED
jgi:hypothetical protein